MGAREGGGGWGIVSQKCSRIIKQDSDVLITFWDGQVSQYHKKWDSRGRKRKKKKSTGRMEEMIFTASWKRTLVKQRTRDSQRR